jgi:hypothetical protein
MMQEIAVGAGRIGTGRRIVIGSEHGIDLGIGAEERDQSGPHIAMHNDVGIHEEQDISTRRIGTPIAGRCGARSNRAGQDDTTVSFRQDGGCIG